MIIAGKEYGSGSSRDWAAKGVLLLGVRAVIAESFERIHRSNLVGMGVIPLQFLPGQGRESLGLTGQETYSVENVFTAIECSKPALVRAIAPDGKSTTFEVIVRVDTPQELEYYRNGGILPYVLRQVAGQQSAIDRVGEYLHVLVKTTKPQENSGAQGKRLGGGSGVILLK